MTNHIDWAWWIVLSPLWGPLAVVATLLLVWLIALALETPEQRKNRRLREALESYGKALRRR